MNAPNYEWKCPREGCKKFIVAYTEGGLRTLSEEHIYQHMREDRERGEITKSIILFRPPDYDILQVTATDIGFLKARGIALDDKIVIDRSIIPQPSKTELRQSAWAKILDRALGIGEKNGTE